ncbi:Protein mothers against dpp [Gryllus bimaculatus]|nr:Protein mothers against dpp [Gryllus bimaculatus]
MSAGRRRPGPPLPPPPTAFVARPPLLARPLSGLCEAPGDGSGVAGREGRRAAPEPGGSVPLPAPLRCRRRGAAAGDGASGEGAGRGGRAWCRLAYWELAVRVGRLFAVEAPSVDVFGAGRSATASASPPCRRARRRRAAGSVTLSCEVDGVWAYNRSDGPIFVNSPTLDDPDSRTLLVYRVPPGHCINVFEHAKAEEARRRRRQLEQLTQSGPTDPNSVRISFAKGWGPKYSRQEVTACPCWIEVLLAPCR